MRLHLRLCLPLLLVAETFAAGTNLTAQTARHPVAHAGDVTPSPQAPGATVRFTYENTKLESGDYQATFVNRQGVLATATVTVQGAPSEGHAILILTVPDLPDGAYTLTDLKNLQTGQVTAADLARPEHFYVQHQQPPHHKKDRHVTVVQTW